MYHPAASFPLHAVAVQARRNSTVVKARRAGLIANRSGQDERAQEEVLHSLYGADADATVAKATELAGSILVEPFDTPVGRMAVIRDPQGATFSIIQPPPPAA